MNMLCVCSSVFVSVSYVVRPFVRFKRQLSARLLLFGAIVLINELQREC